MAKNEWGFTDDKAEFDAVVAWRNAAIADGWEARPTYDSENIERASRLTRDGFVAQILTRTRQNLTDKWAYCAKVSVWGPDGLALHVPHVHDFAALQAATERCHYCGKTGVKTERVGFAGRACAECASTEEKKLSPRYYD